MESWKIILIALAGAAVLSTGVFYTMNMSRGSSSYSSEVVNAYKAWSTKYGVKESDPDVAAYRLGIFAQNYAKIQNHKSTSYTLGQNRFMDLTPAEFKSTYLGLLPKKSVSLYGEHTNTGKAAQPIDWRTKKDVSAVKNQGQCGSCWAFSTTGSLESVDAIEGSGLGNFSEQQLVDCSQSYGNMGCNGGLMDYAFQYVIDNGITTEDKYPYKAVDGSCKVKGGDFKISKYTDVKSGNCDDLQDALQTQPISIGVDAEEWQFYSGGVFDNCGTQLDHGVLTVGFDSSSNWLVKNSWGEDWGESGYITLKSGNTCGICNTASYPTV